MATNFDKMLVRAKPLLYTIKHKHINIFLGQSYFPDFIFITFKGANSSLLTHDNMESLQLLVGGEFHSYLKKEDISSNKYANIHEAFKEVCITLTGKCTLLTEETQLPHEIFAFDLREYTKEIVGNLAPIAILGAQNTIPKSNINMHVYKFQEEYFKVGYIKDIICQ